MVYYYFKFNSWDWWC